MNSKSRSRRWAMLAMSPVRRLSMPTTVWPRSSSASLRCDPMKPAAPVTTVLGMILYKETGSDVQRGAEGIRSGVRLRPLEETADHREPHDLEVERDRPVFDVIEVVLDTLLERGVAAPAIDLRP